MARYTREDVTETLNLDVMLDILANTIACIVLITIVQIIGAKTIRISLGTPYAQEPRPNMKPVYFECRENRIVPILTEQLDAFMLKIVEDVRKESGGRFDPILFQKKFEQNVIGNEYHRIGVIIRGLEEDAPPKPMPTHEIVWYYVPSAEPDAGEDYLEIQKPDSMYLRTLDRLQPGEHFLFFFVRYDSFEIFRTARRLARFRGFKVGWEPISKDQPIFFSEAGRQTGTYQ
jgi:hypothetical protein